MSIKSGRGNVDIENEGGPHRHNRSRRAESPVMTQTDVGAGVADHPPVSSPMRCADRLPRWGSYALDALAVAALAVLLLYLAGRDGGMGMTSWQLGGVIALTAPPAVRELQRVPTAVQAVVAVWALGAVLAVLFAVDRSGFVRATLVYAMMPMAALTTMRLLRRPWGRLVILALLVGAFGLYWQRSFMQWWGYTLGDLETRWLPLSWHNQAATLMGTLGVFFFAMAAVTRRMISPAAGLLASMGLAGVWLAGSRGALVAVVLGLIVAVYIATRWQGWRRTAVVTLTVTVGAVAVTAGLLAMDEQTERVTSDQTATHNLLARFHHMQAAGEMFVSRPVTGYGLGSYGTSSRAHSSPDTGLTVSAHNEFLEPFAEGGLLFGGAVLAGGVLVALTVFRVMTAMVPTGVRSGEIRQELESSTIAGAAAAAIVLLSHAVVDLDWEYPVLPTLLAVLASMVWQPSRFLADTPRTRSKLFLGMVGAIALVTLLSGGLVGAWIERPTRQDDEEVTADEFAQAYPAWDTTNNARTAVSLMRGGNPEEARVAIDRTRTWNPGLSELRGLELLVEVQQGTQDPEAFLNAFGSHPTRLGLRNLAVELLIDRGHLGIAQDLVAESLEVNHAHQAWGVDRAVVRSWELRVEIMAQGGDCGAAVEMRGALEQDPVLGQNREARRHVRQYVAERCEDESA